MGSNTAKDLKVTTTTIRGKKNIGVLTHSDCSCLATFKKRKELLKIS
jgi:hypothetical protein